MKATITISIEVDDLGDLDRVTRIVEAATGDATPPEPEATLEEKKPRKKRASRKAKPLTPDPVPEEKSEPLEPEVVEADEAPPPSYDDVKAAVQGCIDNHGTGRVKDIFKSFHKKSSPRTKLGEFEVSEYSPLIAALQG